MLVQSKRVLNLFPTLLAAVVFVFAFWVPQVHAISDLGVVVEQLKEQDRNSDRCPYCGRPITPGVIHSESATIVKERLKSALTERNIGYSEGAKKGQPYINVLIYRFQERKGGNYAVEKPASVAFHMHLMKDSVVGKIFVYTEDQKALTQNLLTVGKFFSRGGRWVTADKLAEEGINAGLDYLIGEPEGTAETGQ